MLDLVIIGSGPAGLAAAIYARRGGLDTVILEQSAVSGGQVLTTYEVDNYPGLPGINGFELGMKFREHADKMGCQFVEAYVEGIEPVATLAKQKQNMELQAADSKVRSYVVCTDQGEYETRTILLASGASHAKLGVAGENELTGMGVSYCATCDGAFFRNRTVAVIGGGDVAVEDAVFLSRTSDKVYLIHRRNELRAADVLQKAVREQPNIEILWDTVVEKINGTDQVESLTIQNRKTGKVDKLPVAGVFIAVGILPNRDYLGTLVGCDEKGYVIADETGITDTPGIFAAGDVRTKELRQIVTAVADGANAVTSIQQYLTR